MIAAIDIETMRNKDAIDLMPEPEVKVGNLKDPDKIAAKIEEAKAEQIAKAALDPLTARIAAYAAVGGAPKGAEATEFVQVIKEDSDMAERDIVQSILSMLGADKMRIVSWNGIGFDLPMIYRRAMILGVDPAQYGAPPLSAWTKKYSNDRHYDLMQLWGNWRDYTKLDTVARVVLGASKTEFDVTLIPELINTKDGKDKLAEYCVQDTRLTWQLFQRMNGFLFA